MVIFSLTSFMMLARRACICSGVTLSSLMSLSTLLMKRIGRTFSRIACLMTVSVCGMTPSTAHTSMSTPSMALMALVTSPPKSTCPGVSMRLIRYSLSLYL